MAVESMPALVRLDRDIGLAYNEAAFQYFLDLERKRAQRAVRPLLLLLVKFSGHRRADSESAALSSAVLATLATCIREVDFVGWYREGKVAGALIAPSSPVSDTVLQHLSTRVTRALKARLGASDTARMQVRVIALGAAPGMSQ